MANSELAFEFVMDHEDRPRKGNVVRDENGRTRFGVNEQAHPEVAAMGFFGMPKAKALEIAHECFKTDYWIPANCHHVDDDRVAAKMADICYHSGVHQGIHLVQRAINSILPVPIKEDGVPGPATLTAINAVDPMLLVHRIAVFVLAFYEHRAAVDPTKQDDLAGWRIRAMDFKFHTAPPQTAVAAEA